MIPKIIHYCWFGKKPLPAPTKQFIEGWRRLNPEYDIIQWDESNFPYEQFAYAKEAYENRKYAFVSDVARLYALNELGGIYLDTDVEVLKSFDDLLDNQFFMGYETDNLLGTAIIGSTRNNPMIVAMLDLYRDIHFDHDGILDQTTNVERLTSFMVGSGRKMSSGEIYVDDEVALYPKEYFSPKSYSTGNISLTENTYVIHHFDCSWYSWTDTIKAFVRRTLGPRLFYKIVSLKNHIK